MPSKALWWMDIKTHLRSETAITYLYVDSPELFLEHKIHANIKEMRLNSKQTLVHTFWFQYLNYSKVIQVSFWIQMTWIWNSENNAAIQEQSLRFYIYLNAEDFFFIRMLTWPWRTQMKLNTMLEMQHIYRLTLMIQIKCICCCTILKKVRLCWPYVAYSWCLQESTDQWSKIDGKLFKETCRTSNCKMVRII